MRINEEIDMKFKKYKSMLKKKSTATHHLTFNGDTMGAKNKSKAEEKRPILFFVFWRVLVLIQPYTPRV